MTNEEINRAIAAIQGFTYVPPEEGHYGKMTYPKWRHTGGGEYVSESPPPYATDWQWCGPLVEKYRLTVDAMHEADDPEDTENWMVSWGHKLGHFRTALTPQRAICLAVIAAQPIPATLPPEAPVHDSDRS